jgi:chromosome partitioning protein
MQGVLDLGFSGDQDGPVALSENDDLTQRGRAIFDRLRSGPVEDPPLPEETPDEVPSTEIAEQDPPPPEALASDEPPPVPDEVPLPEEVVPAEAGPEDAGPLEAEPAEADPETAAEAFSTPEDAPTPPSAGDELPELVVNAVAEAATALDEIATVPAGPDAAVALEPDPTPVAAPPPVRVSPTVRPLPRIMAIANQKGGVGKTTTAVNLGASLAELGYRVLVIDLDPQGNATTGLGINPRTLETSVYDVIMHDTPLEDCIEPTSLRNLFVVPATIDLAGAEIELVPAFSRELKLRRALEAVLDDFDYTLIDCPPSLGLITVNGLAAATEVVVPIQCEYYALEGLGQLLRNVSLVQANLNPKLEVSAIILTMFDARTKLADQVATEVRAHFGEKVCRNIVPRTVRLSEAPSFGQPIIVFDPSSRGAIAYRELAKEVSGGPPQRTG